VKLRLRRQRLLPLLSALAFAVALALLVGNRDWGYAMATALYLLVLGVALERTGL
jgi:hypothetical protein